MINGGQTIPFLMKIGLGLSAAGFDRRLERRATIDLRFQRADDRVTPAEARVEGDAEVVPVPAPAAGR